MTAPLGVQAPDFTLSGSIEGSWQLSSLRGRRGVVVVFYPNSYETISRTELERLRDDLGCFEEALVQVVAISCDSQVVQRRWAEEEGYPFPLLSDFWPHGKVCRDYDAFDEDLGCARRVTVAIDDEGIIVDRFESAGASSARERAPYVAALARLAKPLPQEPEEAADVPEPEAEPVLVPDSPPDTSGAAEDEDG